MLIVDLSVILEKFNILIDVLYVLYNMALPTNNMEDGRFETGVHPPEEGAGRGRSQLGFGEGKVAGGAS